ncbi:DgyrCDS11611 [Dimorphilus gyrociliatus]|uniref:Alpha-tubulin N-acetyltransferase n=1 Tax=Dimorphilus gyrociliatus TaxID=2664684 RepID=A0A7I8W437_9ANNE|nr:DgyrCDS11611 [Dimorphilus gyrociliatus]
MEFSFNVGKLFPNEITVIDANLSHLKNVGNFQELKNQLRSVVDKLGEASAKAQGLLGSITSLSKLSFSSHKIYLLKDPQKKNIVIGFIKVGSKKLFFYDIRGIQIENDPLCVLDFYVHESVQRKGCGKKLFEFMLSYENIQAEKLAIDKPSHKFLNFLNKHYGLCNIVPQLNNFVVFVQYFRDRNADSSKRSTKLINSGDCSTYNKRNVIPSHDRQKTDNIYTREQRTASLPPIGRPESGRNRDVDLRKEVTPTVNQFNQRALNSETKIEVSNLPKNNYSPPMLRRDGPSKDYMDLLGRYKPIQDKEYLHSTNATPINNVHKPEITRQKPQVDLGTGWNIFGVPSANQADHRKYRRQTKLW